MEHPRIWFSWPALARSRNGMRHVIWRTAKRALKISKRHLVRSKEATCGSRAILCTPRDYRRLRRTNVVRSVIPTPWYWRLRRTNVVRSVVPIPRNKSVFLHNTVELRVDRSAAQLSPEENGVLRNSWGHLGVLFFCRTERRRRTWELS